MPIHLTMEQRRLAQVMWREREQLLVGDPQAFTGRDESGHQVVRHAVDAGAEPHRQEAGTTPVRIGDPVQSALDYQTPASARRAWHQRMATAA
jgi:hypothetical protein